MYRRTNMHVRAAVRWLPIPALQVAVMVGAILLVIGSCAQGSDCQYKYKQQPASVPLCNPYDGGILTLECTAEIPLNASNISIGWFLDCNQLHNNSDITITSQVSATTVELQSRLMIESMSDRYAGKYTCNLLGDEQFIPSDHFSLPIETTLQGTPCTLDFIHSKEEEKCAEHLENGTNVVSLTCTGSEVSSTSLIDITMASSAAVHSTTTNLPRPTPHNSQNHDSMPGPMPRDKSKTSGTASTDIIWPYVVAAVAGLLLLLLFAVAVLYMKNRARRFRSVTHKELKYKTGNVEAARNPLYGASSGGHTPSNGLDVGINMAYGAHTTGCSTTTNFMNMRINEVYGAHVTTAPCSFAAHPMHMRINEVYGIRTQQSMEETQCHIANMETPPHIYDYIPLYSAGNTTWPPAATDISGANTPSEGVTNPLSSVD